MIPTDEVPSDLADEFSAGVDWLQKHGRPELTVAAAVAEAMEDWLAVLRAERLRGQHIPRKDT